MGSGSSTRINEFIKIDANLQLTTIHELDQIIIVTQDLVKITEQLRCRIIQYYDLMFRIVKLHLYKDMKLVNAFKVWYICTLVCNDAKENGVPFECKIQNFDQEVISEEMKKYLIYGSIVAFAIDEKFVQAEKEQLIKCETGICGDFKLQLWPHILNSFLCYLRSAIKLIPYLEEQLNQQIILIRKQLEINKKNKLIKVIDPNKLTNLIDQLKLFRIIINRYHDEVKEFTSNYKNIIKESHPLSQEILREEGNQNYILNDERTILKTKIQDLVKRYLPLYELKGFSDLLEERKLKQNRRKVKPKIKLERRRTEQAAMTFPTQYHWVGHEYYDTLFSAQSLALSELEEARQHGEEARKKLFKKTGVNHWKDNTMKSVFECLTWVLSAEFNHQLAQQEFKLLNQEPWLHFKQFKKHKFSEQAKPLVERLQTWLKYYCPKVYERISNHYQDFQRRQKMLENDKFEFHHRIRDLNPQNQYNALSSFSKNYRVNETYLPKIEKLFEFTIQYNGKMGEELYNCWKELVMEADEKKYVLETPFNEFLQKFRPTTLAQMDELENRKIERRQTKLSIACIEI